MIPYNKLWWILGVLQLKFSEAIVDKQIILFRLSYQHSKIENSTSSQLHTEHPKTHHNTGQRLKTLPANIYVYFVNIFTFWRWSVCRLNYCLKFAIFKLTAFSTCLIYWHNNVVCSEGRGPENIPLSPKRLAQWLITWNKKSAQVHKLILLCRWSRSIILTVPKLYLRDFWFSTVNHYSVLAPWLLCRRVTRCAAIALIKQQIISHHLHWLRVIK
jgi:hypothetical protein